MKKYESLFLEVLDTDTEKKVNELLKKSKIVVDKKDSETDEGIYFIKFVSGKEIISLEQAAEGLLELSKAFKKEGIKASIVQHSPTVRIDIG